MLKTFPRKPLIFRMFKKFQTHFLKTLLLRSARVPWLHAAVNSFGIAYAEAYGGFATPASGAPQLVRIRVDRCSAPGKRQQV